MDDTFTISISDDSPALRQRLEASANSGVSARQIPEIIAEVKTKLRAKKGRGQ